MDAPGEHPAPHTAHEHTQGESKGGKQPRTRGSRLTSTHGKRHKSEGVCCSVPLELSTTNRHHTWFTARGEEAGKRAGGILNHSENGMAFSTACLVLHCDAVVPLVPENQRRVKAVSKISSIGNFTLGSKLFRVPRPPS